MARKTVNYLNNKDILKEIHKSKSSYCSFDNSSSSYDIILSSTIDLVSHIDQAKQNKAERLTKDAVEQHAAGGVKVKADDVAVSVDDIKTEDLVFRVMTWEHIPLAESVSKGKKFNSNELFEPVTEYDSIDDIIEITKPAKYTKVNFPPFCHYKLDENNNPVCIGRSHWTGNSADGQFSKEHGQVTNTLATMYMKLCERYATRSNWRGYCVDPRTTALTQRGWLSVDQITEQDTILSYTNGMLTWSSIKSIYRGEFDGSMFHLRGRGIDALVTPEHKFVTQSGLIKVDDLTDSDRIVTMGIAEKGNSTEIHNAPFVTLAGWMVMFGQCTISASSNKLVSLRIRPDLTDRVRACLTELSYSFSESIVTGSGKLTDFLLSEASSSKLVELFPGKNLTMEFISTLTTSQRMLLINVMCNGTQKLTHKNIDVINMFQALCAVTGVKTKAVASFKHTPLDKLSSHHTVIISPTADSTVRCSDINFYGGKGTNQTRADGTTRLNEPTILYKGQVWCPETEFGCFVAKRNGMVYITGNTYNDEMRSQALLQLAQIGLQFDESKSQNPFAYYTAVITNSFTRVLNIEKKNQNIRDDILEMNNVNPSYTRQNSCSNSDGDSE